MDLQQSISNQTDVSLGLAKHILLNKGKDSNLVLSPFSIQVVLSLIAAGSKGQTLEQLLSFLKANSNDDLHSLYSHIIADVLTDGGSIGGPKLSLANGIWIDQSMPLKHSFKQVVGSVFKADSNNVDFQTKAVEVTNEVNLWVEKETNALIKDVLPFGSVDALTRLIFANAIYFKGAWNQRFDPLTTKDRDFHLLNGSSVQVPFMTSYNKQYVRDFDEFKVLKLPYNQGQEDKRRFSMYLFLPNEKDGLPILVEKIFSQSGLLEEHHLPYRKVEMGDFWIPRFKVSFEFKANEILKGLGLVLPFACHGGLTEMVDSPLGEDLYVSGIFHKSFIEVNEQGTEAAAASVVTTKYMCLPETIDFVADHPFVFVVREDTTGVVLFVGHLLDPLAG